MACHNWMSVAATAGVEEPIPTAAAVAIAMVNDLRARLTQTTPNPHVLKRVPAPILALRYIAALHRYNRKKASIRQTIDGPETVSTIAPTRLKMQSP